MNLLCVAASSDLRADEKLQDARSIARALGHPQHGNPVSRACVRAIAYRRHDGSGAPLAEDLLTGSWILAAGTWFHRDGFASGDESFLLERLLRVGIERLAGETEGLFTFVSWDAATRVLSVVTDLFGTHHVYVRTERESVVIAGSSLLLAALGDDDVDPVGVQEFLFTGILYEGRTLHREVRKLPAATIVSWDAALVRRERKYWNIADVPYSTLDGAAATRAVTESLVSAATRIGKVFRRPACDLTGGRDSRAVAVSMLAAGAPFTAVVCGPSENRDVVVSKQLARAGRFAHCHLPADEPASLDEIAATLDVTDGECDLVEYARVRRIHRSLAQSHDASLNGTFGEFARGHWIRRSHERLGALDAREVGPMRFITQPWDPSIVPAGGRLDLARHVTEMVERSNEGLCSAPVPVQMQNLYLNLRLQHWFGRIASSTDRIWPTLAPWSFRSVLETVLSVAPRAKRNSLLVKRMLQQLNPALARVPLENGAPALPLSPRTLPWFWPAPVELARKVVARARRRASLDAPRTRADLPPRMQLLLGDATIHDVLDPRSMRSAGILDLHALRAFLAAASERDFTFDLQWTRLLSIELMLRRCEELRAARRDTLRVVRSDR